MIVIFILCGIFPVDSFISEDSVAIILSLIVYIMYISFVSVFRIPFGYCDFRIEITDIQVWVGGEVHNEYVQYVYADDVYDTGKEYYASNGVISFKKDGREWDYERAFLLEMDDIELYPEVDITEEYIIKCNIRIK